jgi:DNA-nicking Smr family endonuclease
MKEPEPVEIPINGVLDLHAFNPGEVKKLIPVYIEECRKKNILQVRIIHGKGKGILRERVHSILSSIEEVESFRLAGDEAGGWGATIVVLKAPQGNTQYH